MKNKITVKNHLNITHEVEFLDVPLEGDIPLFLDPYMVANVTYPSFDAKLAKKKIDNFFITSYSYYTSQQKEKAWKIFKDSSEINGTHLGLSKGKSEGKGLSVEMLDEIFSLMVNSNNFDHDELGNPRLLPIFIPQFGPDRFSDLIASIIVKELIEFTNICASKYGLPLSKEKKFIRNFWDLESKSWQPLYDYTVTLNKESLILIPKNSVLENLQFSADDYVNDVILPVRQVYHLENNTESMIRYRKIKNEMTAVKPTKVMVKVAEIQKTFPKDKIKSYALKETLKAPWLLKQYLARYERFRISSPSDKEVIKLINKS